MYTLQQRLEIAKSIATKAGLIAQQHRDEGLKISSKSHQDFVTQADYAVEQYIQSELKKTCADDGFLGEESGLEIASGGMWIVDPIDGTSNYIKGMDYWCISMAFVVDHQVQVAVVYAPDRNELFWASAAGGCYLNGEAQTLKPVGVDQAIVGLGLSSRRPLQDYLTVIQCLVTDGFEYRRFGAGALMLAHVASGQVDAYFEAHLNSWDGAAGLLLVSEAGGKCCDFLVGQGQYLGNPMLVANAQLYDQQSTSIGFKSLPKASLLT
jgi:myo-inositol-1(or 4)-monophosphatase